MLRSKIKTRLAVYTSYDEKKGGNLWANYYL